MNLLLVFPGPHVFSSSRFHPRACWACCNLPTFSLFPLSIVLHPSLFSFTLLLVVLALFFPFFSSSFSSFFTSFFSFSSSFTPFTSLTSLTSFFSSWKLFIYLFIWHSPNSATAGSVRNNAKKRRKEQRRKNESGERVKPSTPTLANDTLIGKGDERTQETGSGTPTQLPWTIRSPPMTHRDHMVSLFF